MRVEASLGAHRLDEIVDRTRRIESAGFDRITSSELNHDPFLPLGIVAEHSSTLELATSVAIAFPRSPTVTAHLARDLNDLSEGRFILGLGTQVKGHIQRRFATEWSSPGPRLRDYIAAVRAVWDSWDSEGALSHEGPFYPLSLMTPEFSPGPSQYRRPPVHIAGVNSYNLRLAGECCEGLRVHPFATKSYMEQAIWPAVREGSSRSGRDLSGFEMIGGGFIATGETDEEVYSARERARYRIAFYGSTRTYLPVLEMHGWGELNGALRRLVAAGEWDSLAAAVPDEVLDEFCVSGTHSEILPKIRTRYEGLVDAVSLDLPEGRESAEFADLLEGVRRLRTASES
ncbi:MAG: TIGR03617 family F420-dependent LLM class oxidoreductase [Thermomicrobiaceae bacterium]